MTWWSQTPTTQSAGAASVFEEWAVILYLAFFLARAENSHSEPE